LLGLGHPNSKLDKENVINFEGKKLERTLKIFPVEYIRHCRTH